MWTYRMHWTKINYVVIIFLPLMITFLDYLLLRNYIATLWFIVSNLSAEDKGAR